MFYKLQVNGVFAFYDADIHSPEQIPEDVKEISVADHAALMAGQSAGKVIVAGPDGAPTLADKRKPSTDQQWANLRAKRSRLLSETDWTQFPDAPAGAAAKFKAYRQALRDLPAVTTDPANPVWPTLPGGK